MPTKNNEERELICSRCGCELEHHRVQFRCPAWAAQFTHPDDGDVWPGVLCP